MKVILAVILAVVLVAVSFALTIGIGYLIGMFIAILPFVSDWLTVGMGIGKSQIPSITAWFAVLGLFIGGSAKATNGGKNG